VIATNYDLPFAFEAPDDNPWDGGRDVDLTVYGVAVLDAPRIRTLRDALAPFWSLAEVGGLAGRETSPWLSTCPEPAFDAWRTTARLRFSASPLDERATHCLICLLLGLHGDLPFDRAVLSAPARDARAVAYDAKVDDPYPALWDPLPFPHVIEDSESEDMVLRARFARALTGEEIAAVHRHLVRWGSAAAAGAFAIAPVALRGRGHMVRQRIAGGNRRDRFDCDRRRASRRLRWTRCDRPRPRPTRCS
jgi:hypothetical protein